MACNYISSIYKGYAVTNSLMVNVEIDKQIVPRMLVSRFNVLEFFVVLPDSLKLDFQIEIFANITKIFKINTEYLKNDAPSFLFILAENLEYGFITVKDRQIVTKFNDFLNPSGSTPIDQSEIKITQDLPRNSGNIILCNIAIYAFRGLFVLFSVNIRPDDILVERTFKIRFPYEKTKDIGFISATKKPLLAILFEEDYGDQERAIHVYEVNEQSSELGKEPVWKINFSDDPNVERFESLRDGSIMVFSDLYISWYAQGAKTVTSRISTQKYPIEAITPIPDLPHAYLALENEEDGNLYLLSRAEEIKSVEIDTNNSKPSDDLALKCLGTVSFGSTVVYLGSSLVFIGSRRDDSKLVRITNDFSEQLDTPYLKVLQSFLNLGFISDLKMIKKKASSTFTSIVTTSGSKKNQQVNMLRSGINLNIEDTLRFPHVKNFWLFKGNEEDLFFVSTTRESFSLKISKNEGLSFSKNVFSGFKENTSTVSMHQPASNLLVQVTFEGVALFSTQDTTKIELVTSTEPKFTEEYGDILLSQNFEKDLYLATNKDMLIHADLSNTKLEGLRTKKLQKQPCAISLTKKHLFVAFWKDTHIQVYDRETLAEVYSIDTEREGIISMASTNLSSQDCHWLFFGYYDGCISIYQYEFTQNVNEHEFKILDKKTFLFGTHPVSLHEEGFQGKKQVFVFCDNAGLFYINEQNQLSYLNVINSNAKKVVVMLENKSENRALALIEGEIAVAEIEFFDKVQTKTLPFDSQHHINLIVPLLEENIYAAASLNYDQGVGSLKLYDSNSYKEISAIRYEGLEVSNILEFTYEEFRAILVSVRGNHSGVVEVHELAENNVTLKQTFTYPKEVVYMARLLEQYVILAVKSKLIVLKIEKTKSEQVESFGQDIYTFKEISTTTGLALIQHIETYKKSVIVVDNVKGLHLFDFNEEEGSLTLVSISLRNSLGSRVGCIINETSIVIGIDGVLKVINMFNTTDSEFQRIVFKDTARINLGEEVTCVLKDKKQLLDRYKIANQDQMAGIIDIDIALLSGAAGSINLIASIPDTLFSLLMDLQSCILSSIPKGFGVDYFRWRGYQDSFSHEFLESYGFVDADILKRMLTLTNKEKEGIYNRMRTKEKPSLYDITMMIEDLSKIV